MKEIKNLSFLYVPSIERNDFYMANTDDIEELLKDESLDIMDFLRKSQELANKRRREAEAKREAEEAKVASDISSSMEKIIHEQEKEEKNGNAVFEQEEEKDVLQEITSNIDKAMREQKGNQKKQRKRVGGNKTVKISGSKTARVRRKQESYREIKEYEDLADNVTKKKGWRNFKIGLGTAALIAISVATVNVVSNASGEIPEASDASVVETKEAEDAIFEEDKENAENLLNEIKEETGFEMSEFTLEEQIEAVIKIKEAEENLSLSTVKRYFHSLRDQLLLDEVIETIYEDEYKSFSTQEKYELRKLAYELLEDEEIKGYIRNPQAVVEAEARQKQILAEENEIGD